MFRISDFGFRVFFLRPSAFANRHSGLLLLPLLLAFSSAQAATLTPDGQAYTLATSSIDGIDCITADFPSSPWSGFHLSDASTRQAAAASLDEEPLVVCDAPDDPRNGLDEGADLSADKATLPPRCDQDSSHFANTGSDAVTLRAPQIVSIFLLPVHCFSCLHKHIRERAPPCGA